MSKIYGYLRVSTAQQCLENCKSEILLKANELKLNCNIEWIEEKKSGTIHYKKRKLGQLVEKCNADDIIIMSEVSRVGRKIVHIMSFFAECSEKKIKIYFTKNDIKVDDSIQSQILIFAFSIASQIERDLIASRTRSALQAKKDKGIILGRHKGSKGKLKLYKYIDEIKFLFKNGAKKKYISSKYGVTPNTVTEFCKRYNL